MSRVLKIPRLLAETVGIRDGETIDVLSEKAALLIGEERRDRIVLHAALPEIFPHPEDEEAWKNLKQGARSSRE